MCVISLCNFWMNLHDLLRQKSFFEWTRPPVRASAARQKRAGLGMCTNLHQHKGIFSIEGWQGDLLFLMPSSLSTLTPLCCLSSATLHALTLPACLPSLPRCLFVPPYTACSIQTQFSSDHKMIKSRPHHDSHCVWTKSYWSRIFGKRYIQKLHKEIIHKPFWWNEDPLFSRQILTNFLACIGIFYS